MFPRLLVITIIAGGILSLDLKSNLPRSVEESGRETVIELRSQGFYPEVTTIKAGERVKFITSLDEPFWPASNPHPTHVIYPEFDSQKPIEPRESWIFRFEKAGEWQYHDHLNSFYRGSIIVKDEKGNFTGGDCEKADPKEDVGSRSLKFQCYERLLTQTLKEKGIEDSLNLVVNLYNTDPSFAISCHDLMHRLGRESYQLFVKYQKVSISYENSYCGFGFYHGFVEAAIVSGGGPVEIRKFCNYAKEQISKLVKYDIDKSCFHGVGHGVAERHEVAVTTDNEQEIIDQNIPFCEQLADTPQRLSSCVDGIISSATIALIEGSARANKDLNVIAICNQQRDIFKEACYQAAGSLQLRASHLNFDIAAKLVNTIPEEKYSIEYIRQIALTLSAIKINENKYEESIKLCRRLEYKYQIHCLQALATGIMQLGQPGSEYIKAKDFCLHKMLSEEEKRSCVVIILNMSKGLYSKDKIQSICSSLPESYRHQCQILEIL